MTREEMVKRHWKPYMIIEYKDEGMLHSAECLLSAIDFDAELLTLTPINEFYDRKEFTANLKYCSFSKRLKAETVDGAKLKVPNNNFLRAKILPNGDPEEVFDDAS